MGDDAQPPIEDRVRSLLQDTENDYPQQRQGRFQRGRPMLQADADEDFEPGAARQGPFQMGRQFANKGNVDEDYDPGAFQTRQGRFQRGRTFAQANADEDFQPGALQQKRGPFQRERQFARANNVDQDFESDPSRQRPNSEQNYPKFGLRQNQQRPFVGPQGQRGFQGFGELQQQRDRRFPQDPGVFQNNRDTGLESRPNPPRNFQQQGFQLGDQRNSDLVQSQPPIPQGNNPMPRFGLFQNNAAPRLNNYVDDNSKNQGKTLLQQIINRNAGAGANENIDRFKQQQQDNKRPLMRKGPFNFNQLLGNNNRQDQTTLTVPTNVPQPGYLRRTPIQITSSLRPNQTAIDNLRSDLAIDNINKRLVFKGFKERIDVLMLTSTRINEMLNSMFDLMNECMKLLNPKAVAEENARLIEVLQSLASNSSPVPDKVISQIKKHNTEFLDKLKKLHGVSIKNIERELQGMYASTQVNYKEKIAAGVL